MRWRLWMWIWRPPTFDYGQRKTTMEYQWKLKHQNFHNEYIRWRPMIFSDLYKLIILHARLLWEADLIWNLCPRRPDLYETDFLLTPIKIYPMAYYDMFEERYVVRISWHFIKNLRPSCQFDKTFSHGTVPMHFFVNFLKCITETLMKYDKKNMMNPT